MVTQETGDSTVNWPTIRVKRTGVKFTFWALDGCPIRFPWPPICPPELRAKKASALIKTLEPSLAYIRLHFSLFGFESWAVFADSALQKK